MQQDQLLFPILTIRFYAIGFIDGDPDFFFMFNCAMGSENEFKAILCCHVVKPPNIYPHDNIHIAKKILLAICIR